MDSLIRYFDEDDKQVKVRYLDSCFLGHSTNADLFEQFTNAVEGHLHYKTIFCHKVALDL